MSQTLTEQFDNSFKLRDRQSLDRILDAVPNVSDFYFCDREPIRATVQNRTVQVTSRPLDAGEIKELVFILGDESNGLYQNLMTDASPRDRSYTTLRSRVRHRVNLTVNSAKSSVSKSVRVVMRRLAETPWKKENLRMPPGLLDASLSHEPGLVMVLGATGSGKTSLLSGQLRELVENPDNHGHLVTIEDPVEYSYDAVASPNFMVTQLEVGVGCKDFADGMRAATRMHPTHILIGEIRDPETAASAIAAARSGHRVFATMHTSSVPEMFARWSDFFPESAQRRAMADLATVIDYAVYQTLEHTEKGFMPVQESLSLVGIDRPAFVSHVTSHLDNLYALMKAYLSRYGTSHDKDRMFCNPSTAPKTSLPTTESS